MKKTSEQIAGHPIVAPQLGRSALSWRHGYGTDSDGHDTNAYFAPTRVLTKDTKSLIIYFSRSGSTELLAAKLAKQTGADLLEITVRDPYPARYLETLNRANNEREGGDYPEPDLNLPDLSQYQTIYLGYPIWAMTLAHPMVAFLTTHGAALAGKKIIPFMTQGGYGAGDSVQRIGHLLATQGVTADLLTRPLVVNGNAVDLADGEIRRWLAQQEVEANE